MNVIAKDSKGYYEVSVREIFLNNKKLNINEKISYIFEFLGKGAPEEEKEKFLKDRKFKLMTYTISEKKYIEKESEKQQLPDTILPDISLGLHFIKTENKKNEISEQFEPQDEEIFDADNL